MAGHVTLRLYKWGFSLCLWSAATAWAMGPGAPFVPPVAAQAQAQGMEQEAGGAPAGTGLSGVRLGRHAGAVIDGQWVRRGQTVRGAKLVSIQRTQVSLRHPDGHTEMIEMYPPAGGTAGAASSATTEAAKP